MKTTIIGSFVLACAACTNGQGEVDVTASTALTFPAAPAVVQQQAASLEAVTTDTLVTLDLQKDLASLSDLGTLSVSGSESSLSGGDLAFLRHIKATVAAADGTMPEQLLCDVDVPRNATTMGLPLSISDSQVLAYLKEGKVSLHFFVTGAVSDKPLTLTHTLIAHMNVAVQRSVVKL
ncbi:MAG: hypothetical protein M3O36_12880 [Myxococcota bacterium]|nr:hypothetical protein [Myxococcota bacterium]